MNIQIREESIDYLAEQAKISIAFEVDRIFDVKTQTGGFVLAERKVDVPYVKDYDAINGEGPARWARRFDVSKWGFIVARANGQRVGGAVIAFDTAGVEMLEGRGDLAVLWDIRVMPEFRGRGVGSKLFAAAESRAGARGCRELKVETQNINVGACRFYQARGCALRAIDRDAYTALPDEIRMLWYKEIVEEKADKSRLTG